MIYYSYATLVAVVCFGLSNSYTLAPICPEGHVSTNAGCVQIACPSTHYWYNGSCQLRSQSIPCEATNTCVTERIQAVAQPYQAANTIVQYPVQNTVPVQVTQPCPATPVTQPCPATTVTQPCPVTQVTQPCPVVPVTPCPVTTVTKPCPVTPVVQPCPTPCVTQSCSGTQPCSLTQMTQPCPMVPVTPCSSTTVTQPCPSTTVPQPCPSTTVTQPCPSTTVTQPCPSTTVTQPCPSTTVTQPCPSTTVTQPCPSTTVIQPSPVAPITVTVPVPAPAPAPCPLAPQVAQQVITQLPSIYVIHQSTPPTPQPQPQPTPPPPPATSPRPEPTIRCPAGTILINRYCHLIYCGSGIYQQGKCIITVCPEGTVWNGSRCKAPEPRNQTTLHLSNVVTTNIDQTAINPSINFTNNIEILITEEPFEVVVTPPTIIPEVTVSPTTPSDNCCFIIPPPTCSWSGKRYMCRSRKHKRCGSICTREYIYLSPPPPEPMLPPPPPPPPAPCPTSDCGNSYQPHYPDCNRCEQYPDDSCMSYCRRPVCRTRTCQTIQLRSYCESYPSSIGCQQVDGCTQDWCGGY